MNILDQALKAIQDAPYEILTDMLEEKIRACGVTLKARERRQLLQHLKFNADSVSFRRWDFWRDRNFSTAFGLIAPTLDSVVALRILVNLEKDVGESFLQAYRQLERDAG